MPSIGIDVGSTAAKAAVFENGRLAETLVCPTGFSSVDAAERLAEQLLARGFDPRGLPCVATGYGRVAVPYADRVDGYKRQPDPWSSYTRSSPAPGSSDAARRAFSASASGRRSRADTLSAKPTTR